MTKTLQHLKELNAQGEEVTMAHVITYACGLGLHKMRRDVGRNVFGFFKHSKRIGVSANIQCDDGHEVPITFWNCHEKSLVEFAKEYREKERRVLVDKDTPWQKIYKRMEFLPTIFVHPLLWIISYININMGIEIKHFGLEAESVGHYLVCDVS